MTIVRELSIGDYARAFSDTSCVINVSDITGLTNGDLLIAICIHDYTTFTKPDASWTVLHHGTDATTHGNWEVVYKFANNESGTYTFGIQSYAYGHISVHRISGAGTPTSAEQYGVNAYQSTYSCPTVNVTESGSMILWCGSGCPRYNKPYGSSNRGSAAYRAGNLSYAVDYSAYSEVISSTGTQTGAVFTFAQEYPSYGHTLSILIPPAAASGLSIPILQNYYRQMRKR